MQRGHIGDVVELQGVRRHPVGQRRQWGRGSPAQLDGGFAVAGLVGVRRRARAHGQGAAADQHAQVVEQEAARSRLDLRLQSVRGYRGGKLGEIS